MIFSRNRPKKVVNGDHQKVVRVEERARAALATMQTALLELEEIFESTDWAKEVKDASDTPA